MSQERAESSLSLPDLDVDYSEFPTFEHKDRLRWVSGPPGRAVSLVVFQQRWTVQSLQPERHIKSRIVLDDSTQGETRSSPTWQP